MLCLPAVDEGQAVLGALVAARAIGDGARRAAALAALATRMTPGERDQVLREAMDAVLAISDEVRRSEALAALAPRLADLGATAEARDAVRVIGDELSLFEALAALAPRLSKLGATAEALVAARVIGHEVRRNPAPAFRRAKPALPTDEPALTRAIGAEGRRFEAMAALASLLVDLGVPAEAMATVEAITDEGRRAKALATLAPRLTLPLLSETLDLNQA